MHRMAIVAGNVGMGYMRCEKNKTVVKKRKLMPVKAVYR